ncbi:MAG: hypothetical protein PSV35_05955, partial [bacterium]|nr:hypothetical protein [bacterium]
KKLINKSNQIKADLYVSPTNSIDDAPTRKPGFWSKIGSFFSNLIGFIALAVKYLVAAIASFVLILPRIVSKAYNSLNKKSDKNVIEQPPVREQLTEEEAKTKLLLLQNMGAKEVADATGLTELGGEKKRDKARIESALHTRFGMVLASQMVAATQNDNHRDLNTVIESLTRTTDDNATIEGVQTAVKSVVDSSDVTNPLNGEHACSIGGNASIVTAMEFELFTELSQHPEHFEQYGIVFSNTEKMKIDSYQKAMRDSKDISHVLKAVGNNWGGYRPANKDEPPNTYYKKEKDFEKNQGDYEKVLAVASNALQQKVLELADGESLYLETGLEEHAMQLVIKKEGGMVTLSTYDSSGALENTALLNGGVNNIKNTMGVLSTAFKGRELEAVNMVTSQASGLVELARLGSDGMRKNALTFKVPVERLGSPEGLNYLSTLIKSNSMAGWAQTHIALDVKHTSMEERSHLGWWADKQALIEQAKVYAQYIKNFSSIASNDAPPEFRDLLQRPQNTGNCFAKKAQACQLYELGKSTYKKVRLATVVKQKEAILDEVCGKIGVAKGEKGIKFLNNAYVSILRDLKPQYLSPQELHQASMRLTELRKPPSKEYYVSYFESLLKVKEALIKQNNPSHQPAVDRINEKIATHAREFYTYLKTNGPESKISKIFAPVVYQKDPAFNWNSGVIPLKTDAEGMVDTTALNELSDYSNAVAWKATIQILNHQIKKLSVNQRHLESENERLPHYSNWGVAKVTSEDLLKAKVISFPSGASRKDMVKVELNINGTRGEIDVGTFFYLLRVNKEVLADPHVVGIIDFLRNADPAYEKIYKNTIYELQRSAFINKLAQSLDKQTKALDSAEVDFKATIDQLIILKAESQKTILLLKQEIAVEKKTGKNSVKLENLNARLVLLEKESLQLNQLQNEAKKIMLIMQPNSSDKLTILKKESEHEIQSVKKQIVEAQNGGSGSNNLTTLNTRLAILEQEYTELS